MSIYASLSKACKKGIAPIALLSVALLTGCGGGGGDDDTPPTVRPKTLAGLIIKFDSGAKFEFLRGNQSGRAILNGDVESGAFIYTLTGNQLRQYPNQGGDTSDTRWPDDISNASYEYRAINDTSAVLTLYGVGVNDLQTSGGFNANNGSFTYLFNNDSFFIDINEVQVDLTFSTDGNVIDANVSTIRIPGSSAPHYDVIYVPSSIERTSGGSVPENYNPDVDPNAESIIAPESLNDLVINYTNGIPDPNFDFTIQFVTLATNLQQQNNNGPDETGQGLLRIGGAPVDLALDYTWKRITGTDDGILTLSGSGTTFDGNYTIKYIGLDSGDYIGEVDGDTPAVDEVSGSFYVASGV